MASSTNTPTTFGATIVPTSTTPTKNGTRTGLLAFDTPNLTPTPSHENLTATSTQRTTLSAYSPFYEHERSPLDRTYSRDSPAPRTAGIINEKDVEAGLVARDPESPFTSKVHIGANGCQEDRMWPSKQTLLQGRQAEKRRKRDTKLCRGCAPVHEFWARRSRKQRLGIKIAIALVVIGLAVTIGLCISIAVHGSVNTSGGQQQSINVPQ